MLGARQHGHIAALGFDLYCRMLERAVQEKRGEAPPTPDVRVSLDLGVDFRLPESYVSDAHQRLILYKRVAAAADEAGGLERVREEIEDRFGHLPQEAENLLEMASIRILAERLGIVQIKAMENKLHYHFVDAAPIDPERLLRWVQCRSDVTLSPSRELTVAATDDPDLLLEEARETLEALVEKVAPTATVS